MLYLDTPKANDPSNVIPPNQSDFVIERLGNPGQLLQFKYKSLLDRMEEEQSKRPYNGAALPRPFVIDEYPHPEDNTVKVPIVMIGNEYAYPVNIKHLPLNTK
ncbi:hypothetical protein GS501_04680 [Saccharibacter sp. 17.LH.SD]|uniref:hypothetical protein n=1 Tax=Saccharibacter sp. 17.LH.SD TaxID=2689393 RepID=UPI0013721BD5|nr:hypothetical protein [Saccharibacter sp. 17.LH.SD]MXV44341.1 hypothetical protein [Saccharibacter sp. 17.LH.SD]